MEKRPADSFDLNEGGLAKRFKSNAAGWQAPEEIGGDSIEAVYYLEQHLVGWVIGRSGATLKEIEANYQVKVVVDQSTKDLGYSSVSISGSLAAVQATAQHINESLTRAASGGAASEQALGPFLLDVPPLAGTIQQDRGGVPEELTIEQRFVGWLLGKGGGVVREIETASGSRISINQDTRDMGYSKAQIHGTPSQRAHARDLIIQSIDRASASQGGGGGACAAPQPWNAGGYGMGNAQREEVAQVEQKWVGWLLGKSGGVLREIEQETGCRISLDQSTKQLGYSSVQVSGDRQGVELAMNRIHGNLQKVGGSLLGVPPPTASSPSRASAGVGKGALPTAAQVQIDQQWIGWLLGRGGGVIREIEAATGAKISLNQETKDLGYSIASITASNGHAVKQAQDAIVEKVRRVSGDRGVHVVDAGAPAHGAAGGLDPALAMAVEQLAAAAGNPQLASELGGVLLRAGAAKPALGASSSQQVLEAQVEQKWVGWLLGKQGKTMRDIEQQCGASVSVDQSTKDLGYSVLKIEGSAAAIERTKLRIQASLDMASSPGTNSPAARPLSGADEGGIEIDLQVEQRLVGWILGKAGSVLKEIEAAAGVKVAVDQSTRDLGFSTVRISGGPNEVAAGKQLIQDKLVQAGSAGGKGFK